MTKAQIPKNAMHFAAPVNFDAGEADGELRISGTSYDGGKISNHWFWNDANPLVIDVATLSAKGAVPINIDHDAKARIGNAKLDFTGGKVMLKDAILYAKPAAQEVHSDGAKGHPFGQSLGLASQFTTRKIEAGKTAQVNGRDLAGPFTLALNARVQHVAITDNPADPETSATFFSAIEEPPTVSEDNAKQASLEAENQALKTQVAALTAATDAILMASRKAAVKGVFSALSLPCTDEDAAPYLKLDEAQFSAITLHLKNAQAAKPAAPNLGLFSATVPPGSGSGAEGTNLTTTDGVMRAANAYIAAQKALGNVVEFSAAVQTVTGSK